jgi:hypothetical protein
MVSKPQEPDVIFKLDPDQHQIHVNPQHLDTFPAVLFRVLCLDVLVVYFYDTFFQFWHLFYTPLVTLLSIFFFRPSFFSSCSRSWCVLRPGICLSGSEQREFNAVEMVETNARASRQSKQPHIYHCLGLSVYQPIEAGFWSSVTLRVELASCVCTYGPVRESNKLSPPLKGKYNEDLFYTLGRYSVGLGIPVKYPWDINTVNTVPPYYSSVSTQISDAGNFFSSFLTH